MADDREAACVLRKGKKRMFLLKMLIFCHGRNHFSAYEAIATPFFFPQSWQVWVALPAYDKAETGLRYWAMMSELACARVPAARLTGLQRLVIYNWI